MGGGKRGKGGSLLLMDCQNDDIYMRRTEDDTKR